MDASERFHQILKSDFAPLLRAGGFKGSGSTFRRLTGERIDVINVQGSRYGGQCCVNFGVHFSFLPLIGSQVADPKKLKEYECTFHERLHEATESDHWWSYGASDAEAEASASSLVDMYKRRGEVFFGLFEPFPDVFEEISPSEMNDESAGVFSRKFGPSSRVSAALIMSRIMKHIGHVDRSREFAAVGLANLGRAVGLQPELERLRDGC
jgi:hypothetical protein